MGRLSNKTAIVTAAGQGIGRATARRFAEEGAHVIAVDINAAALESLAGVERVQLDLLRSDRIAAFAAEQREVDILFNCAGIVHSGTILTASENELDLAYALNVKSAFHMIQAFLPGMIERSAGTIINVASVAGSIIAVPNRFVYGTTKAALIGLTRSVALDYAKSGVRCNAICPGTVDSPSLAERLAATGDAEAARAEFAARQPIGRIGSPEEIAELAVYMASDASAYMTGSINIIDGGWSNA
jgi:2-keto-3-deoxy-L-fuconate dehydrogenase